MLATAFACLEGRRNPAATLATGSEVRRVSNVAWIAAASAVLWNSNLCASTHRLAAFSTPKPPMCSLVSRYGPSVMSDGLPYCSACPLFFFEGIGKVVGEKSRLHLSDKRGCQEKRLLPAPRRDAGVVTYIQPSHSRKGDWLAALARRRLQRRYQP
jgi:hypothetical protein